MPSLTYQPVQLSVCLKGQRDYVHGTDLYEAIVGIACRDVGRDLERLQMNIRRFFHTQPDLQWSDGTFPRPPNVVVDFSVSATNRSLTGWLLPSARPVECRNPYDEDKIGARCGFTKDCVSIQGDPGFLPIEVAVSMTKHLHNRVLQAPTRRWIFTKLDLRQMFHPSHAAELAITLKENLHGRLTKSEIHAGKELLGHIYFSLVHDDRH